MKGNFRSALNGINCDTTISFNVDPNLTLNNLYNHINTLLDEFAPYKELTMKEIKLKSKQWITIYIQQSG